MSKHFVGHREEAITDPQVIASLVRSMDRFHMEEAHGADGPFGPECHCTHTYEVTRRILIYLVEDVDGLASHVEEHGGNSISGGFTPPTKGGQ